MTLESPATETIFITGGYGCIGAETAKWLIRHTDCDVVVASRSVSRKRNREVFGEFETPRLKFVQVDVVDQKRLQATLIQHRVTHALHLAGMQTPDCNEHRDLGLQTNLAGTQNLIEAMKVSGCNLKRFVFASSMAVYGPRSAYAEGRVPMHSEPKPVNVYGTWKLAGEHLSRLFAEETDVPTISVRPGALFGPGRNVGLTATPTTAMKHVAAETAYEIPYRNRQDYLYSPDVGAEIANCLVQPFEGYEAFTLPSHTVDTNALVQAMRYAAEDLGLAADFGITVGNREVPFICDVDYQPFLDTFPEAPHTPLEQAVRQSIEHFIRRK